MPVFLDAVERFLAADPAGREEPSPLFFIFHMLGDYREKSAYRPLARLLSIEGEELDRQLGDAITSTSHRVMAAVFDGDPRPLYEVIESEHADQFVRSRMFETLAMLVVRGELDQYDWLHLHHEDFTGQYGKFYASFRNEAWYRDQQRLYEAMARRLNLPADRVIVTVDRHANTSAASIPLALCEAVRDQRIRSGDLILMEAMGGGFTWGSALVRW